MRHRSQTKTYGHWLKLIKKTNPKTGRRHYSVIADPYYYVNPPPSWGSNITNLDLVNFRAGLREHFDPAGNRGMKGALSWKFSNKEQAEQLITMALLKWGERYVA